MQSMSLQNYVENDLTDFDYTMKDIVNQCPSIGSQYIEVQKN